jgi:hypothetical protein
VSAYRLHGEKEPRGEGRAPRSRQFEGRFGRLFRRLAPAPEYTREQLSALAEQMREPEPGDGSGGWGGPEATPVPFDNPLIPAAYTYFGQFVDHDITFDPVSSLQAKADPDALTDFRSPRFDLDSLYGSGPADEPFHYDRDSGNLKLLIGSNENGDEDLPRNTQGTALIGDPRNDENIIVSQLQLAFIKFHNKVVDRVLADPSIPDALRFDEAQRIVRWHYQWVVVHDYLPLIVGPELVDELFPPASASGSGREFKLRHYEPKRNAFMPVEFSAAGFRFGHSQVRPAYHLSGLVQDRPIFLAGEVGLLDDLRGFRPLPGQWTVDWSLFLEVGDSAPQPSRLIDAKLAAGLFSLPGSEDSLALHNLLRGQVLDLPSGQAVAAHLGVPIHTGAELGTELDPTPLWFYILKESELAGGQRLGPVGATIVAEVLLGLLNMDPLSFVNLQPDWRPTLPSAAEGHFTLSDLVNFTLSP